MNSQTTTRATTQAESTTEKSTTEALLVKDFKEKAFAFENNYCRGYLLRFFLIFLIFQFFNFFLF